MRQVINLLAMRDSYHPILSRLFKKYRYPVISIIMNGIVGCSCFILLAVAFLGLSFFYTTVDQDKIIYIACGLIIVYSFLVTVKTAYAFFFSGKDIDLLKTLPITKTEIFASNFVFFYKNQILFSLYIISSAVYSLLRDAFSLEVLLEGLVLAFLIPAITILFVFFLSLIIHFFSQFFTDSRINEKLKFKKRSSFFSLVIYEKKNLLLFASLKTEILLQWVMSIVFTAIAFKVNYKYISFISLYPAISMINVSSFSREGKFHNILQTLPIDNRKRIMAKVTFYMLLVFPVFILCYGTLFAMTRKILILLLLIPNLLFVLNTSLMGVKTDMKNPRIYWTNPQESFRMNFLVFFSCIFLGVVTELLTFYPDLFFIKNQYFAILGGILLNLLVFMILVPRKGKNILQEMDAK
ncbi:hypothetical protein [Fibrobacter sp. UWB7]|uniref:hypothetical protein n=1 Tax=Fibrobacter sp. UWB7 TaxID=1896206 RepID=UPI0014807D03|nr:hypothetical protein [Fibrobacter sp. UWB7]